jgi:hypothetical protein
VPYSGRSPRQPDHNHVVGRSHFRKYASELVRNGSDSEPHSGSSRREARQRMFSKAGFYLGENCRRSHPLLAAMRRVGTHNLGREGRLG